MSNFRRDNIVPYVYGINAIDEGPCGGSQNLFVATRLAPSYDWIESIVLNRSIEDIPGTLSKYREMMRELNCICKIPFRPFQTFALAKMQKVRPVWIQSSPTALARRSTGII